MQIKSRIAYGEFCECILDGLEGNKDIPSDKEYRIEVGNQAAQFKKDRFGEYARQMDSEWQEWIKTIKNDLGPKWARVRNLTNQRIKDLATGTGALEHALAVHYRLHAELDDPRYAEAIDRFVFAAPFAEEFQTPVFEWQADDQALLKVHLGPVTIVLGEADDLNPLSLQEPVNQNYMTDGMPDVFKALDWRSRLSGFHGRRSDADKLYEWARDESSTLKVMLVSGPGGVGKSRLAADVVTQLVHSNGWRGGFLGDANRPIDGNGTGVALIIDDPEERTALVAEILKAAALALHNNETYGRPVRLLLLSRESREAWAKILNEPASFIDELRLDAHPYIELADAAAIAEDIAIEYPERIGRAACDFSGVKAWLENPVHRLPLNVVAASVHAVLDPNRAFRLDGAEILTALADWELRRVRYYSERDLCDRDSLEKLLGLSLLTQAGLTKHTVFELGEKGFCVGKSGDGLLESVRRTPFWRPKLVENPGHLLKLEPDRPAASFCIKALRLYDPSPSLSRWLASVASQHAEGFGARLSRLAFDIGQADPTASRVLEQQCIEALEIQPNLVHQLHELAYNFYPFSADFVLEICRRLLEITDDAGKRAVLMNNQAYLLYGLGRLEAARDVVENAISIYWPEETARPDPLIIELAGLLTTKASVLNGLGQRKAALEAIEEAVSIGRHLVSISPDHFLANLVMSLHNSVGMLAAVHQFEAALEISEEVVSIYRQLESARSDAFLPYLAMSLSNHAALLNRADQHEVALKTIDEAIQAYGPLVEAKPDVFLPEFARLIHTQATILFADGQNDAALVAVKEAISIRRSLAMVREEVHLPELARSLNTKSRMLYRLGHLEAALVACEDAVSIRRSLAQERPDAIRPDLAVSLYLQARILADLDRWGEALLISAEAISTLRPSFIELPNIFKDLMSEALAIYDNLCEKTSTTPHVEDVEAIAEAFKKTEL
jgi:tetratricopeptide (TPR) repeat protein